MNRNIWFRDGRIVRDEKVQRPRNADDELLKFGRATEEIAV